jgi:hypothetical protein
MINQHYNYIADIYYVLIVLNIKMKKFVNLIKGLKNKTLKFRDNFANVS